MISRVFKLVRSVFRRLHRSYELRRYTPHTIAEYLRRQGMQIGDGCFIVPTSLATEPYLVKIGNRVAIAQDVTFITHDGGAWLFRGEVADLQAFGPIIVEDNVVIGQGTILFPNVRIGANSIVGAGSIVINDIPPNSIVMGVPARPFGSVDKYREKCLERWAVQRPPDVVIEPGATWWNSRHFNENRKKLRRHLTALFHDRLQ